MKTVKKETIIEFEEKNLNLLVILSLLLQFWKVKIS